MSAAVAALVAPSAEAYLDAGSAPVLSEQFGCAVWTGGKAACFYSLTGAIAGVEADETGSVDPYYYAGGPGASTGGVSNVVYYSLGSGVFRGQEAELGEIVAAPTGDYVDVNADIGGCKVEFELRRRANTNDALWVYGPSVAPKQPNAAATVVLEKDTMVDGTGSLCGKTLGVARVLAFTYTLTGTSSGGGEYRKNRMAEVMAQVEKQTGVDLPDLPSRIEPLA